MNAPPSIRRRPVALLAIVAVATLAACGTSGSTEVASDDPAAGSTAPNGTAPVAGDMVALEPDRGRVEMSPSAYDAPEMKIEPMASSNGPIYFRLNVYLDDDLNVSLTPEGELVVVSQTDVYAGPEAFTSYQLSDEGIDRLLARLVTHPLVTADERVGYRAGVSLEMGGSIVFDAHPDHGAVDPLIAAEIDALIDRIADPTWLGDDVVSGPTPWVPDSLTVVATRDGAAIGGLDWPLPSSITAMSTPGMTWNGAGETIVCLSGADAAAFWPLLAGQNHANLPVVDAEGGWNVNVLLSWPGYRLAGDPCGAGN